MNGLGEAAPAPADDSNLTARIHSTCEKENVTLLKLLHILIQLGLFFILNISMYFYDDAFLVSFVQPISTL